jgi:hypothetical protein
MGRPAGHTGGENQTAGCLFFDIVDNEIWKGCAVGGLMCDDGFIY